MEIVLFLKWIKGVQREESLILLSLLEKEDTTQRYYTILHLSSGYQGIAERISSHQEHDKH